MTHPAAVSVPLVDSPRLAHARAPLWAGLGAAALLALTGCAQMPTGPSVAVMPGPHKPFEVFVQDDRVCRDWAQSSSGSTPGRDAAGERFVGSAVTGAVLGAAVGAMAGGGHGSVGVGAAVGGTIGAAAGADQSSQTAYGAQRRYDIAYQQCMYAKGNQLPNSRYVANTSYRSAPAPVPPAPPAGVQPPPAMRQ